MSNVAEMMKAVRNLDRVGDAIDSGIVDALDWLGTNSSTAMKGIISVPVFPRSLPGQPPRRETGRLQAGVGYSMVGGRGSRSVKVGAGGVKYAKYLEQGTSKMAARPFVAVSTRYHIARFRPVLVQSITQALMGAGLR